MHDRGIALAVTWVVAAIALDVHGLVGTLVLFRPTSTAHTALAVALTGSRVLQRKVPREAPLAAPSAQLRHVAV